MKRNTPRHAKTRALAKALEVPRCTAVGLLELLWHATAQLTPRGDIGRLEDEHIAEELWWDGDTEELIASLVNTGWLDRCSSHRLLVHGWSDHCDQTVRRTRAVREQGFAELSAELVADEQMASVPETLNPEPETQNRHQPKHPPPDGTPARGAAPWALELSALLIERIRPIAGARIPKGSLQRWAKEIEKLVTETPSLSTDGGNDTVVRQELLHRGIEWAFSDANLGLEFEVIIRSGSSLREKWSKLCEAKKRADGKRNGPDKQAPNKRASELVFGSREWCVAAGIEYEAYQLEQAAEAQRKEKT